MATRKLHIGLLTPKAKAKALLTRACGKSSLTIRLSDNKFSAVHDVTIAAEIGSKVLPVGGNTSSMGDDGLSETVASSPQARKKTVISSDTSSNNEKQHMKLQIWDTAGQEHFRAVTRSYFRNAAGCLLVYDVTRKETFLSLKDWLADLRNQAPEDIVICLVGNKSDLVDEQDNTKQDGNTNQRQVLFDEAEKWAQENGIEHFIETSAKTGENVVYAYQQVANNIYDNIRQGQLTQGVKTNNTTSTNSRIISLSKNVSAAKTSCC